jgi:ATP adenylyltransferase
MLLVPRSTECFNGVSINWLVYAGALLVRNEEQMKRLEAFGPIRALQTVSVPLDA